MGGSSLLEGLEGNLNILSLELPLDRFYRDLNHNDKNLTNFYSESESLFSKNIYSEHKRLCSVLLRFLKNSITRTNNTNSDYDDCILFNYWVYDKLSQRYNYKNPSKVIHAFGDLQGIWNSLISDNLNPDYYNKCKPDFDIPTQDDWKQRKELYDYCVNYELIKPQFEPYKQYCKHHYTYIKSKAPLYDYFKEQCKPGSKYKCPDFYNKCKDYDPVKVLSNLPCYEKMRKQEATAAATVLSEEPQPELAADGIFSPDASKLKGDGNHPVTKSGNILLGVVVTSMTSGALYKFTPLGNMLRNRFGWSNNMRNFNGGDNGLFDYASESFNPFSVGGEEHYIGYHPA